MSRRSVIAGAAAAVVVAGGVVAWQVSDGSTAPRAAASSVVGRVETVQRRNLVDRLTADGTLGYSGSRTTAAAPAVQGTYTWLPQAGATIASGARLYEVDDEPVILLDGAVPAWRELGPDTSDGVDVRQLQAALGVDATGSWNADTTAAVKDLQDRHGLDETGRLELGRVVFLPGPRRVSAVTAQLGGPAGTGPVLTTTSTRPSVKVALDAADQEIARDGMRVDVVLPDGRSVRGRVTSVGRVAQAPSPDDQGGSATVTVRVELIGRRARSLRLDEAPVSVRMARERRQHVLAVPVTALIGVSGGGFAMQTPDGGRVAVTPGLEADGYVEVSGPGVREGLRVVVPE